LEWTTTNAIPNGINLSGNRVLKLDLEIVTLANGATLDLTGGWIKLRSQGTPDNPITAVFVHDLNLLQMTTYKISTGYPTNIYDEDLLDKTAKTNLFAERNRETLLQEMAQGGGEHIAALATLLDVPTRNQPAFFRFAQDHYRSQTQAQDGAALHNDSDPVVSLIEAMEADLHIAGVTSGGER
jgi:hypothetical protein